MSVARSVAVTTAFAILGLAVACTTPDVRESPTFCGQAKSAAKSCQQAAACDATIATNCEATEKVLSPSTAQAAQDCLESGICSSSYCLTRAQKSSKPTERHRELADRYCSQCAPDVADCTTQFYAKQGRAPGTLVLPFGGAVAAAVADACTTDTSTCRANFATCAAETIGRTVSESVGPEVADCLVSGFRRDDAGGNTGPSTGPEVLTCTPENCTGCCRDDRCIEGGTDDACGLGGAACQTCSTGQSCKIGQCKEPCGPNNCEGCCDGDTCVTGDATAKCGAGGAACETCTTRGASFVCSNNTCIDGSCQATCASGCCSSAGCQPGTAPTACGKGGGACINCGYGRACGATTRACELDPASTWNFTVLSAVLPAKTKSGGSWEIFGDAPDPYVVAFSSGGGTSHTGQTTVKDNTLVPSWVEAPLTNVKASELLNNTSFEVWDSDVDYDDLIGGCRINITPALFDGNAKQVTCQETASSPSVTLKFKIAKP